MQKKPHNFFDILQPTTTRGPSCRILILKMCKFKEVVELFVSKITLKNITKKNKNSVNDTNILNNIHIYIVGSRSISQGIFLNGLFLDFKCPTVPNFLRIFFFRENANVGMLLVCLGQWKRSILKEFYSCKKYSYEI